MSVAVYYETKTINFTDTKRRERKFNKAQKLLKKAMIGFKKIDNFADFIMILLIYISDCQLELGMTLNSSRSLKEADDNYRVYIHIYIYIYML